MILPKDSNLSFRNNTLNTLRHALEALLRTLPDFFSGDSATKTFDYPARQGTEFGYYVVPEEKEYLTLRCHVHARSSLEDGAARVWNAAGRVFERVLKDLATGLQLKPDIWDDLVDETARIPEKWEEVNSATLLRLFRYVAGKGVSEVHTDLGLLTICFGDQKGLQLLDRRRVEQGGEERWTDVEPGDIVLLVGQTVRGLTGGVVRAGVHRVVASGNVRHSVVFAMRHSWKNQIDLGRFGGEGSIQPKLLFEALGIGVLNINAQNERRAKQRVQLERMKETVEEVGEA